MKRVGITTTMYGNNFGEAMQAFAIYKAINMYCPDCCADLINYTPVERDYALKPGFENYAEKNKRKNELFQEFREMYLRIKGKPMHHISAKNAPDYDKYVFGSDQIWNTAALNYPEHFGSFVPKGKSKIAYAPSVGAKATNPALDKAPFIKYIDTFEHLSVREKEHVEFIQSFTNKKVYHVADPTLLLTRDSYKELLQDVEIEKMQRPYIFFYHPHAADVAMLGLVNKVSRKEKYDVVHAFADIPQSLFAYDSKSVKFEGPRQFLAYLSNSSLVVTRSFHAVVFSIIFERPFYAYVDKKTGSRIESLCQRLGLEDRLVYDYLKPENVDLKLDYTVPRENLRKFREESLHYLQNALL